MTTDTDIRLTPAARRLLDYFQRIAPSEPIPLIELSIATGLNYATCSISCRILAAHGLLKREDNGQRGSRYRLAAAKPETR